MKHRIVHLLQKYFLNPPIKILFAIGIVPPGYALLETVGRKTGKPRRTPVGDGRVGNQFWIVAEHGVKAGYVRNIQTNPRVRLKLREDFALAGITARRTSSTMMMRASGSGGLRVSCLRAPRMRGSCAYLAATAYGAD